MFSIITILYGLIINPFYALLKICGKFSIIKPKLHKGEVRLFKMKGNKKRVRKSKIKKK